MSLINAPLSEMPSKWRIWFWYLWPNLSFGVVMTVVVTSLGIITTHEAKVFVEPSALLAWSAAIVFLCVFSMSLYWAWKDPERRRFRDGDATRYTLNFLARHPDRLIVGPGSVGLWEEAVKRIPEEEEQEREREASEHRVQALLSAVPDAIVDYRGNTLRWYLGEILTAMDAFVSDNHVLREAGFERFYLLYKPVLEAIARQLAEDAALELVACSAIPPKENQLRRFVEFLEAFDIYLDRVSDGVLVDVHVHSDAPAALRRAIAYILSDEK